MLVQQLSVAAPQSVRPVPLVAQLLPVVVSHMPFVQLLEAGQAAAAPHVLLDEHVCIPLPEHCVAPGVQEPLLPLDDVAPDEPDDDPDEKPPDELLVTLPDDPEDPTPDPEPVEEALVPPDVDEEPPDDASAPGPPASPRMATPSFPRFALQATTTRAARTATGCHLGRFVIGLLSSRAV